MNHFFLCIDDTDDTSKSIGTGEIASHIYDQLKKLGCQMHYSITRHQLLLDPRIAYTSHNSSMCMEGSGALKADDIWKVAADILNFYRSPISNPGICLYMPDSSIQDITATEQLISFGLRAKKEVLTLEEAVNLTRQISGIRLKAPAGNGNGQIGALAGIGLRLQGNDGTFRGKILLSEPVTETVEKMKKRLDIDTIWDGQTDRILADDEMVRAINQIKLVYRNHKPMAAVLLCEDGTYELCNKASVYEQTITKSIGLVKNCKHFKWDNDTGEQWNETAGTCMNCLHRRLTDQGMVCQRKGQGGGRKHRNKD